MCTEGVGEEHAGLVGAAARSEGGGEGDSAAAADQAWSAAAASVRVAGCSVSSQHVARERSTRAVVRWDRSSV